MAERMIEANGRPSRRRPDMAGSYELVIFDCDGVLVDSDMADLPALLNGR